MTRIRPWTRLHLQVATPLFNSGAEQTESTLRIPSLRGAMRFWFRALAGTVAGDDLALLSRMEAAVFGRAALLSDRNSTVAPTSPVVLRLRNLPAPCTDREPAFLKSSGKGGGGLKSSRKIGGGLKSSGKSDYGRGIVYLLGQGLAEAGSRRLTRSYLAPDATADLELRLSGDETTDVLLLASLWLLCAYGGLGSRTRRGFGALHITKAEGPLPEGWTPETVCTPGLNHYEGLHSLCPDLHMPTWIHHLRRLAARCGAPAAASRPDTGAVWAGLPTYPVLSHTVAATRPGQARDLWHKVLGYAGEQYRWFRARENTPGVNYKPPIKTTEWLNTVHGPDHAFALGALGLPVNYKGGKYVVNADGPAGPLRRASPLWIRAAGNPGDGWRLFTFAFHCDFLPDDVGVHIRGECGTGKAVTVTDGDLITRTQEWIDAVRRGKNLDRSGGA